MSVAASDLRTVPELPLVDRILAIVSMRGSVGITRDELLRKLGVSYDGLVAALDQLAERQAVRLHWPSMDSFRVFYTG